MVQLLRLLVHVHMNLLLLLLLIVLGGHGEPMHDAHSFVFELEVPLGSLILV